ncbi:MAG: hypothetical protein HY841_15525 [Bacteroidetes bacterium]|nr:hypothetical protein [Bacteroidota bacterium]
MKKLLIISVAVLLFASCEKLGMGKKHKTCATVSADAVPAAVTKAFSDKHPGIAVTNWFNKDDKGYAARFNSRGKDALDFFDNNGNFQKEEVDEDNQQGNHQDGDDDDGCECETGD